MIEKLQRRFILLSMSAFFVVMVIIIAGINIVNYSSVVSEADELLTILSDNKGTFPIMDEPFNNGQPEQDPFSDPIENPPAEIPDINLQATPNADTNIEKKDPAKGMLQDNTPPTTDPQSPFRGDDKFPGKFSPETPYESRYFSVTLNRDSEFEVETSRVVSVDTTQATAYAEEVIAKSSEKGFVDSYRFMIREEGEQTRITFLDWGRKLDSFQNFLIASVIISLIGYLVVFALIAFFARRIIRPISESYEKQKRFITDAGHEIKTPLTIIHADADVLEMEIGENEFLQDIQKQAKRLTSLTNDLVMLSRMEESDNTLQMIEFPISDMISETAASFQALAQTQKKDFQCQIQPLLSITGNEKALNQLINILLDNALKYSPEGGSVSLVFNRQGKNLHLDVYNTTLSDIPRENLPHIFDRFYRMDPSRNSETGGHGIGLSVAKAIVTAHGGKITASAKDEHSLLIHVVLPVY